MTKTSAPGSLMILGEHAVLHNSPAYCLAIDQRIYCDCELKNKLEINLDIDLNQDIIIQSDIQNFSGDLNTLSNYPKLNFIYYSILKFTDKINWNTQQLFISIKADFKSTLGFGSSAAVLASVLAGLYLEILNQKPNIKQLFNAGLEIIQTIQTQGSGTDLITSLTGGLCYFEPIKKSFQTASTQTLQSLTQNKKLTAIYCGYKTPTAKVIQYINHLYLDNPDYPLTIYQQINDLISNFNLNQNQNQNNKHSNWPEIFHQHQILLNKLGVSDPIIRMIISRLKKINISSKISGSGLGDCIIALCAINQIPKTLFQDHSKIQLFSINPSKDGLIYES